MDFLQSTCSISIKKDQDRSYFDNQTIIVCDGVGQFSDSAKAADLIIEELKCWNGERNNLYGLISRAQQLLVDEKIDGGSTLIISNLEDKEKSNLRLAYIGNGSIIHMHGDFGFEPNSIHRFSNLMIPHVDKNGTLIRHISRQSIPSDLQPTFLEISLTAPFGDIILFFTDGIVSLEGEQIIVDDSGRIWRNQSEAVSFILNELHQWLQRNCNEFSNKSLLAFNQEVLEDLKVMGKLEDDASMGIIITEGVLKFYRGKDE
jgi:hypothetical protein